MEATKENQPGRAPEERKDEEMAMSAAFDAVRQAWGDESAWDDAEAAAETRNDPSHVADLYREALDVSHATEVFDRIANRAVMFFEEWFGEDEKAVNGLLSTIIEKNNLATWAFDRLTEYMTVHEQWDELFDTYDRLLRQDLSPDRRRSLLEEAINIARDIADNPEKSIRYLKAIHEMDRSDTDRFQLIEETLEQGGRWEELIELWRGQMPLMSREDAAGTWIKIANCYFTKLVNPQKAFAELKRYLRQHPGDDDACGQLVQLLGEERFPLSEKLEAVKLLNEIYVDTNRREDAVVAIEAAIPFCDEKSAVSLHRMASSHLALLKKDEEAIGHLASLLLIEPDDADALKYCRLLSVRAGRPDLRADALAKAADRCDDTALKVTHLLDAARIFADELNEHPRAVEVLLQVSRIPSLEPATALSVAHKLNGLYAAQGMKEERLRVLTELSTLEQTDILRRTVAVEAARLAAELGDTEKALTLWHGILEKYPRDMEALSAIIELLSRRGEYPALAEALIRRADISELPEQRRMDLVRAAELYRHQMQAPERAVELWRQVFDELGPREDAVSALDSLLTSMERFDELGELLHQSVEGKFDRMKDSLIRGAKLNGTYLNKPEKALEMFERVLTLDPRNPDAIAGMESLIANSRLARRAVRALVTAHRAADDWGRLIALTPRRLQAAEDNAAKVSVYLEAAELQRTRADNPETAVKLLACALPLDPDNHKIEAEMLRLAKDHGCWDGTETALHKAADAVDDNLPRQAYLKKLEGGVLESVFGREDEALEAYCEAVTLVANDREALESMFSVATRLGRWLEAVQAFLELTRLEDEVDSARMENLRRAAMERDELAAMLSEMSTQLSETQQFRSPLRRQLQHAIATGYREDVKDLDAAEAAAERAVAAEPNHLGSLSLLGTIQRENGSSGIVDTLERVFELKRDNLDFMLEAAKSAGRLLEKESDRRRYLVKLYDSACSMWRVGKRSAGKHDIETCCHYAVWEIARMDEARGLWNQSAELLSHSARLRFNPEISREMRMKAAALYEKNGMNGAAIEVYNAAHLASPEDEEALRRLEHLLKTEERLTELLAVKKRLLNLVSNRDEQIALRMDIAKLARTLEGSDVAISMLQDNLRQDPGHDASVLELIELMRRRQMFRELAALLEEQAGKLAERAANDRAAGMMFQAAKVYEENLGDVDNAIAAFERVLDWEDMPVAMDALARLNASQNRPNHTISWLKRRLSVAKPVDRVSVLLRLARAQLKAGQNPDAVTNLEEAFDEAPKHPEIRSMLLKEYRTIEDYESLASVLARASAHLSNPSTALAYSAEAANLYFFKLHVQDQAVEVLERACALAPEDEKFKSMLAEALVAAGQHERASTLLKEQLRQFGRRRSIARGAVHLQLAKLAQSAGDAKEAVAQLELATAMDKNNVSALKTLAELNRDIGDLDQAEKSYRSLLLLVRRESPKEMASAIVTPGEILLELSLIASEKAQADKAAEIEEKAFGAFQGAADELERVSGRLKTLNLPELLARVYERFIELMETPPLRARVRSRLADLLAGPLDRPDEAFAMRLDAVSEDPRSPTLHDLAEEAARERDQFDRYVDFVQERIDASRKEGDELNRCELLLRLARIHMGKGDLDAAWNRYEQASDLCVREVDVLKLGVELAKARDDGDAELELLTKLSTFGETSELSHARADALYRLAEINLAVPATFEEGLSQMKQGFNENPNPARAGRILLDALKNLGGKRELLSFLERVIRQSDDPMLRLEHHELKAALAGARTSEIRDGASLALTLDEEARAEALMRRMLSANEVDEEDRKAVTWAILTLADKRREAGDLRGAFTWLQEASESATSPEILDVGLALGEQAAQNPSEEALTTDIYRWLLALDPSNQKAWAPLSEIYYVQKDIEGFEALVQESLYTIESPTERNKLRLHWSKLLLETEDRREEALEGLKNIQLDEPAHSESLQLIAKHYLDTDRKDDLLEYLEYRFEAARETRSADEVKSIALTLAPLKKTEDEKQCRDIYRVALELLPGDDELIERLFAELTGDDCLEERASLLEHLLRVAPDEKVVETASELIAVYRQTGDQGSVERVAQQAYLRAPESMVLQRLVEESYRKRGDYQGLMELLQQQVPLMASPESKAKSLLEIARIARDKLDDLPRQIEALEEAVALSDKLVEAWFMLMDVLREANRYDEVIALADRAVEKFQQKSHLASILNLRGHLLRQIGKKKQGLKDLKKAFTLAPKIAADNLREALGGLIVRARNEGNADVEKAYIMQLNSVLSVLKKPAEQRVLLQEWLDRFPQDLDVLQLALTVESDTKQWEAASSIAEKVVYLTAGEEQVKSVLRLTSACMSANRLDVASKALSQVYEANPENQELREALLYVYEQTGEYDVVSSLLLEDAMKETDEPKKASLLRRAGTCLSHTGEGEAAIHTLHRALKIAPDDVSTCAALIDVYVGRGQLDMANDFVDEALIRIGKSPGPERGFLQYKKAIIMGAYGDNAQKLYWLEQAFQNNWKDQNIALQLANLSEEMEEWDLALKALARLAENEEPFHISRADAMFRQAKIYHHHREDTKRAIELAQVAVETDPSLEAASFFLMEIGAE